MTAAADRLATVVLARVHTSARPLTIAALAGELRRFAPADATPASWLERIAAAARALAAAGAIGLDTARPPGRVERRDSGELERRLGRTAARSWPQLADRVLPALALGIAGDDSRLDGRDAWAAAIAARAIGLWRDGPPPSPPALCDALVWQRLALPGRPGRCPPELRAHFLQRELATDPGPPDRLLRLYAAREIGAPRPELRALRDALVRRWLAGAPAAETSAAAETRPAPPPAPAAEPPPAPRDAPAAFAAEVHAAARGVRGGTFGDRKVFISALWHALRERPGWAELTLDQLKARLVEAHRAGELVLARADLVAAMDPELVAASETTADGASFHFLVREASS